MGAFVSALKGAGQKLGSTLTKAAPDVIAKAKVIGEFTDNFVHATTTTLKKYGPEGEQLIQRLTLAKQEAGFRSGEAAVEISNIWKPVDKQRRAVFMANPAVAPAENAAQQKMAIALIGELNRYGAKTVINGKSAPLPIPQNGFYPKILRDKALEPGALRNELIEHLFTTQQAKTKMDAEKMVDMLEGFSRGRKAVTSSYDLMGLKVPDKFLELDPEVAYRTFADQAHRFIARQKYYGQMLPLKSGGVSWNGSARLAQLVETIGQNHGQTAKTFAANAVDLAEYGYGNVGSRFYSKHNHAELVVRRAMGVMHLSRTALVEPSQNLNSLLLYNVKSLAKATVDIFQNHQDAVEHAMKSGALLAESLRDLKRSIHGDENILAGMMHYTGFDALRKFGIVLSANASKHYARELAEKLVRDPAHKEANAMFRFLGVEPSKVLRQGGLVQDDLLRVARNGVERTQFITTPIDLPLYWGKNPFMRTMALYKSFAFMQAKNTYEVMKVSAEAGKYQNFAYLFLAFPVIGELFRDMELTARGKNPVEAREDESAPERYVQNLAALGHLGMYLSIMNSINRGAITGFIGGPVGGDLDEAARGLAALSDGDAKPIVKAAIKKVPVIGTAAAEITMGKKND